MPERDRGPARRYARNYVDARLSIAEFFIPASLVLVAAVIFAGSQPAVAVFAVTGLYVLVIAAIADAIILGRRLRGLTRARFGRSATGAAMYGVMRAFQIRRTRLPSPLVTRGEWPS